MSTFTPTWHPKDAGSNFRFYNSINKTSYIYYDSNTEITLPTTFFYESKSNNSFTITRIEFNTNSTGISYIPSLPNNNGKVIVQSLKPNSGASAPTMDIYCSGIIKIKLNLSFSWSMNSRPNIGDATFEILKEPIITLSGNNYFPNDSGTDEYIYLTYNGGDTYFNPSVLPDSTDPYHRYKLIYDGDYVSISGNWFNSETYSSYNNSASNLSFHIPTTSDIEGSDADNDNPTIEINWNIIVGWEREEVGCDGYTCDSNENPCNHTEPDPDCPPDCIDQCEPLCYTPTCTPDCPLDCPTNTCPPHHCPYGD